MRSGTGYVGHCFSGRSPYGQSDIKREYLLKAVAPDHQRVDAVGGFGPGGGGAGDPKSTFP